MSSTPATYEHQTNQQIDLIDYANDMQDEVLKLWHANFNGKEETYLRDIKVSQEAKKGMLIVAKSLDKIVGTCLGATDGHRAWVYYLCVDATMRRRGIASQLLDQVEQRLSGFGCKQIGLLVINRSVSSQYFYRSRGYCFEDVRSMGKHIE